MKRSLRLLLLVLLAHQAWPDQLGDSYLVVSSVRAASVGAGGGEHEQEGATLRRTSHLFGQPRPAQLQSRAAGRPAAGQLDPASSPPLASATRTPPPSSKLKSRPQQKLILLTDGHQIELFPLDQDESSTSAGHYVIKASGFDLTRAEVVESLGSSGRHLSWLRHRQQLQRARKSSRNGTSGSQQRASILPQAQASANQDDELANEGQLYLPGVWRKPFISNVGHLFHRRFCDGASRARGKRHLLTGSNSNSNNSSECLVIYWLDRSNNVLHFGSSQLESSNELFSASWAWSSSGGGGGQSKVLELSQFPPLDLCAQTGVEQLDTCHALDLQVEPQSGRIYALVSKGNSGLILAGQLEASSSDGTNQLGVAQKSLVQVADLLRWGASGNSLRNVLARSQGHPAQLLFLDNKLGSSTKIAAINLEPGEEGASAEVRASTVLDVQWETTKMKVKRSRSNKLDESFTVASMALAQSCGLVWLTSDNELYLSNLGQRDRNLETKFLGKLIATRPLIRAPVVSMQLVGSSLFFLDSTRRSLMAYKLRPATTGADQSQDLEQQQPQPQPQPHQLHLRQRHQQPQDGAESATGSGGGGVRFERVPSLPATHRVLLVHMAPIQDFSLIELSAHGEAANSRGQASWCAGLSQLLRRQHEGRSSFDSHASRMEVQARGSSTTFKPARRDEAQAELLAERLAERLAGSTRVSHESHISFEPIGPLDSTGQLGQETRLVLLVCLLLIILVLALINYILWTQKSRLLALMLLTSSQLGVERTSASHDANQEKPAKGSQEFVLS